VDDIEDIDEIDPAAGESLWPRASDQLFGFSDDWWNNACINFTFDTWDLYASGYLQAAKRLAKSVVDSHRSPDAIVYPMAFLYRHYLELRLKIIIAEGQELLDLKREFPQYHRLDQLWKTAKQIIESVYAKDPKDVLGWVEDSLLEFSRLDQKSFAFRYPHDKSWNKSLKGMKYLNVRQFAEVMARVSRFLESVSGGISQHLDDVRQLRAEYRE
jgi:hypothetical protein